MNSRPSWRYGVWIGTRIGKARVRIRQDRRAQTPQMGIGYSSALEIEKVELGRQRAQAVAPPFPRPLPRPRPRPLGIRGSLLGLTCFCVRTAPGLRLAKFAPHFQVGISLAKPVDHQLDPPWLGGARVRGLERIHLLALLEVVGGLVTSNKTSADRSQDPESMAA